MRRNLSVSLVGLTLLAPRGAAAQVFTWIGPPAGSWSNPANWSGGAVPTAQSTVIIDGAPGQNTNVAIDVPASITALSLSAGDSATVLDGRLLRFDGSPLSTIDGPGMLVLGSPTGAAQVSADRSIRLSGGGTMNLAGLGLLNAGLRIEQSAYSILGTGLISALVHQLDAQSRIEARPAPGAAGAFATLQLTVVHDISNAGTMSAATGGTLLINSSALFSTGTVCAADGATVTFTRDTTLVGGTYGTAGSGVIVAQPSAANDRIELRDVNLAGLFRSERAETRIVGSLANSGTLLVQTPGTVVRLGTGTTHFSGNGAIRLGGTAILADATATLRQSGGHGIRGDTDATGVSVGAVLNEGGVIDADVPGRRLTLAPAVAISNSGTLSAGNGGELLIGGAAATLDNRFGVIAARGAGSQVRIERPLRIFGGSTQTDAAGEVVFDAPTGTLTLDNLVNNGRLRVQSGTLSAGASGLLINNGTLSAATIALDGTITLVGAGQFNAAGWITNGAIINLGNRIGGQGLIDGVDNRAGGIVDASGTQLFLRGARANAGLMRASNGGTLYAGFLDNTGGRIEAAAGSQVNLLGAINTGTLAALAGGSFTANTNGATLGNGVTLLGPGAFGTGTQSGFQPIRYTLLNGQSMSVGDNPVLEGSTFSVSGSASVNLIGAERAVTLKDMTLNAGAATLNVGPGTLNLQGRVTNRLNINLSSISTQYPILMPVGVATLTGGGTILAAGGSSGGGRLVNLDNTIYLDSAFFGLWAGGWENYGALRGRGGNSSLYLRGTTSINRGLISSGVLTHFQMVGSGGPQAPVLLDNAGGVIESVGNSSITLENTVIQGGAINATFGRVIAHGEGSVTLRDVSISGDKLETGYGRLRLESFNTLAPGGMITVGHAVEDGGELLVSSQGTLTGSGSIRVLPKGRVAGAGRLTLEGITVFGVGRVGSGLTSLTLDPGSSLIARRLDGFPGSADLVVDAGTFATMTNRGRFAAEAGARLVLQSGVDGRFPGSDGSISVQAGASVTTNAFLSNGRLFNDGTFTVLGRSAGSDQVEGSGRVEVSGGNFFGDRIRQRELAISGTGSVLLEGPAGTSRVNLLSIESSGRLDVRDSAMVIDYPAVGPSPFDQVRTWVSSGYAGGSWNGVGIISSRARNPTGRWGVGYAEAAEIGLAGGIFLGEPVDATAVLMRYTLAGDTDLDGSVGVADFARLAAAFNLPAAWSGGDFNYDGMAGIADFSQLAGNFNRVLTVAPARTAVPEPAVGVLALGFALTRRWRGRRD